MDRMPSHGRFELHPQIQLILGPMYSGKTSELIRRVQRFQHAKKTCCIIKYALDTRYSEECLSSHDRRMLPAIPARVLCDISAERLAEYDVVSIDEGQFFPDVVEFAERCANAGKVVIIAALDGDFRRKPFGRVLELIPMAERVDKLTAVCTRCCADAAFTKRTVASTEIELIGGAESYRPVCRTCFFEAASPSASAVTSPVAAVAPAGAASSASTTDGAASSSSSSQRDSCNSPVLAATPVAVPGGFQTPPSKSAATRMCSDASDASVDETVMVAPPASSPSSSAAGGDGCLELLSPLLRVAGGSPDHATTAGVAVALTPLRA